MQLRGIWIVLSKIVYKIDEHGIVVACMLGLRKILNIFYNYALIGNKNIQIDYTSRVEGIKNIVFEGKVSAGKHFWLATYEKYQDQVFQPRIIFKGNFSASDFCHIGATNYIEIGRDVLFGSKVYVTDHNHGKYSGDRQSSPDQPPILRLLINDQKVVIGDNVWIGDNSVILPGVEIGKGSIIGANSVVTKSIPDYSIAVGIPARLVKKYDFQMERWVDV